MKNGCSNAPNFKVEYLQIRHFPPKTDIIKLIAEKSDKMTKDIKYGD